MTGTGQEFSGELPPLSRPSWADVRAGESDVLGAESTEVVIVGAGLVGLTTALVLAEAGMQSVVLDARTPGRGTTGGSTGKVSLLQGTRAQQIAREHGREALALHVEANRLGQERVRRILGQEVVERDAWTYATEGQGHREVLAEAAALREAGVPAELAQPAELPFDVTAAVRLGGQFQLDPGAYLGRLLRLVREAGVKVVWPCRVTGIETDAAGLRVTAREGQTVRAKHVILATLLPFPVRTALFAATRPARSYALTGVPSGDIPQGMYLSAGSPTRTFRPTEDAEGRALLLVGGHGHPTGKGNPASGHLRELAAWAGDTFDLTGFTHRWSAQDYVSVDHLPHVGPSPFGPEGLLVATGFGKWGIAAGTAAADLLCDIVTGDPPSWGAVWRPRLARSARGWAGLMTSGATVAGDLASGWAVDPGFRNAAPSEGEGRVVRVKGKPTAVSVVEGRRLACSAVCTHLGGIVRWNDAERSWDCPLHGSRFAPDGEVETGPATAPLHGSPADRPAEHA